MCPPRTPKCTTQVRTEEKHARKFANVCFYAAGCFVSKQNNSVKFILVVNQLDAQNLFYSKFISCLYMFRASYAHRQEVKIVLYSIWYRHIL